MAVRRSLASFDSDFGVVSVGTQRLPEGKPTSIARYAKAQNLRSNTPVLWQRVYSERRTSSSHPLETGSISRGELTGSGHPYRIDHPPSRETNRKAGSEGPGRQSEVSLNGS